MLVFAAENTKEKPLRVGSWMKPWAWLALLALPPVVIAVLQLGRLHPDEVYQFLEPAFFRAHGYGVLAWEWKVGLRNWAIPGLMAWILKLCAALGVGHPHLYRAVLAIPQFALHAASLWAVYQYAERRVPSVSALGATVLVSLYGLVLLFAGRTMGESFSTAFLLLAMEALDRPEGRFRVGLWGGLFLGAAVVARYGSAVCVVAALLWLAASRRWSVLLGTLVGGGTACLLLGILDAATWGQPFHSLKAYLDFNVFTDKAAQQFGASPWTYYVPLLLMLTPLWVWAGIVFTRPFTRLLSLPVVLSVAYLLALFFNPHKEARFLYPGLCLLAVGTAPEFVRWLRGLSPLGLRRAVAGAAVAASLAAYALYPWDLRGDQFRAIVQATRGTASGLLIVNEGLWGAGGFFYIGKNIPWMTCDHPQDAAFQHAMRLPQFNRAVTLDGRALPELTAHGFRVVGQIGRETLLERP